MSVKRSYRMIKCRKCGESGVLAGGLHKVGDGVYECNNRDICKRLEIARVELLAQIKPVKK